MIHGNASAFAAALRDVRRAVDKLGQLPRATAIQSAPLITADIRQQFDRGVDPYGSAWKPLKQPAQHGPPPLTGPTRKLRATKAEPMTSGRIGLTVRIGARYGAFHQLGFRVHKARVPARKVLPNRGIPAAWRAIFDRTARALARRATAEVH